MPRIQCGIHSEVKLDAILVLAYADRDRMGYTIWDAHRDAVVRRTVYLGSWVQLCWKWLFLREREELTLIPPYTNANEYSPFDPELILKSTDCKLLSPSTSWCTVRRKAQNFTSHEKVIGQEKRWT